MSGRDGVTRACRLLVGFALLIGASAQQATVRSESVPVYSKMDASSDVVATLKKGDAVAVDLSVQGGDGTQWCGVQEPIQKKSLGYVLCDNLDRPRQASRSRGALPKRTTHVIPLPPSAHASAATPAASSPSTAVTASTPATAPVAATPAPQATPATPAVPATQATRATPAAQSTPAASTLPATPATPAVSSAPATPATPAEPVAQATPGDVWAQSPLAEKIRGQCPEIAEDQLKHGWPLPMVASSIAVDRCFAVADGGSGKKLTPDEIRTWQAKAEQSGAQACWDRYLSIREKHRAMALDSGAPARAKEARREWERSPCHQTVKALEDAIGEGASM